MATLSKKQNGGSGFGSLFPDLFDVDRFVGRDFFKPENLPSVNVKETDQEYIIDVAAPGLKKDHFKVEVNNGILSVSAENKEEKSEKKENYTRKEFSYSSFSRSFSLPDNANPDAIKAKYHDGILKLKIPKIDKKEAAQKQIDIE